jgi:hypothetical protein
MGNSSPSKCHTILPLTVRYNMHCVDMATEAHYSSLHQAAHRRILTAKSAPHRFSLSFYNGSTSVIHLPQIRFANGKHACRGRHTPIKRYWQCTHFDTPLSHFSQHVLCGTHQTERHAIVPVQAMRRMCKHVPGPLRRWESGPLPGDIVGQQLLWQPKSNQTNFTARTPPKGR